MKFGKGTVKKYSREYTRTLKSGEKRKYKTEQIQITIPKQEDIYENGEEVLIIPQSEKSELEDIEEIISSLEFGNYLLKEELSSLKEKNVNLEENETYITLTNNYNELKNSYEELINEKEIVSSQLKNQESVFNERLSKVTEIKDKYGMENETLINENQDLIDSNNKLKESNDSLKSDIEKLKENYNLLEEEKEKTSKDYLELKEEYNNLIDKYNEMVDELIKINPDIFGDCFTIPKEIPLLRDLEEYAYILDACGKNKKAGLGLSIAIGERERILEVALDLQRKYRDQILKGLSWIKREGAVGLNSIQYLYTEDKVLKSVMGTIASIGLSVELLDNSKPVLGLSRLHNDIKISGRTTREMVDKGVNLGKALNDSSKNFGGQGGGHDIAAGAMIPYESKDFFLKLVDEMVEYQLNNNS